MYFLLSYLCYIWQNHKDVLVVVDHEDYSALLEYLRGQQDDQEFRRMLAWKAFQHVASYDSAVSEWLWKQSNKGMAPLLVNDLMVV
jgi:phosphoribosylaminoimidazolecarboxamide formyltransferase/IMP cyclohydrolase